MDISEVGRQLKEKFNFFGTLTDDELHDFLRFCDTGHAETGDILWREGDNYTYATFIISGKIGIKKKTEFEGKHMILGTFSSGTVVGELCLLIDKPRSVTAEVLDNIDTVTLTSEQFEQLLTRNPKLGLKLLKHIFLVTSQRLTRSTDRIAKIF